MVNINKAKIILLIVTFTCISIAIITIVKTFPGPPSGPVSRPPRHTVTKAEAANYPAVRQATGAIVEKLITQSDPEFATAFSDSLDVLVPTSLEGWLNALKAQGIQPEADWNEANPDIQRWIKSYTSFISTWRIDTEAIEIRPPVLMSEQSEFRLPGTVTYMSTRSEGRPFLSHVPREERVHREIIMPMIMTDETLGDVRCRIGMTMTWNPIDRRWVLTRAVYYDVPKGVAWVSPAI